MIPEGRKINIYDQKFSNWIQARYNQSGKAWLDSFDVLLDLLCDHWKLKDLQILDESNYNFTAFCLYKDTMAFLKIAFPEAGLSREYYALSDLKCSSLINPINYSEKYHALLLPRLLPGKNLLSIDDDRKQTTIAANLLLNLPEITNNDHDYPTLDDWFGRLDQFKIIATPIDCIYLDRAQKLYGELSQHFQKRRLLHGDFHHYNILNNDSNWQVIDPKGVMGMPIYETCCFLYNPAKHLDNKKADKIVRNRIEIFADLLDFDQESIAGMAYCQSVLSACWCIEDKQNCWQSGIRWADIFYKIFQNT